MKTLNLSKPLVLKMNDQDLPIEVVKTNYYKREFGDCILGVYRDPRTDSYYSVFFTKEGHVPGASWRVENVVVRKSKFKNVYEGHDFTASEHSSRKSADSAASSAKNFSSKRRIGVVESIFEDGILVDVVFYKTLGE